MILLDLITLLAGYDHVDLQGVASVDHRSKQEFLTFWPSWRRPAESRESSNDRERSEARFAGTEGFGREESDIADQERNRLAQTMVVWLPGSNARPERFERKDWSGLTPHP